MQWCLDGFVKAVENEDSIKMFSINLESSTFTSYNTILDAMNIK